MKRLGTLLIIMILTSGALINSNIFAETGRLIADESDIENLNELINGKYYWFKLYNYNVDNYSYNNLIMSIMYGYLNDSDTRKKYPDPLNKFFDLDFSEVPAEEIDFLVTNIFHAVPNHNYFSENEYLCDGYFYEGNYYYQFEGLGGFFPIHKVTECTPLVDGKYFITAEGIPEEGPYGDEKTDDVYILADLRYINDVKEWTFYNISRNKDDIFNSSAFTSIGNPITVILNGTELCFDEYPYISEGTTMVPMRIIFEALGAEVNYDAETRTISVIRNDIEMELVTNSDIAKINGEEMPLGSSVVNKNGTAIVPLRFVSEGLGAKVEWDGATNTITITD